MMGRQNRDQRQLFYEFSLDEMIPADHLLRQFSRQPFWPICMSSRRHFTATSAGPRWIPN